MIIQPTIVTALGNLGFDDGWAASESEGITIWNRNEPQPSDDELIVAGWAKPTVQEETPTE